jgi:hypothetical protein
MSKDLAFNYSEQESIENPPVIVQEESNEYIELLKRIQSKEETLSFSSLKEFAISPKNFIKYKLKERKKPTDAVLEGSLCDALLCDYIKPDGLEFEANFCIVENTPSTVSQEIFCNLIIEGYSVEEAKKTSNARGDANDLYEMYKSFILSEKSRKQSISKSLHEKCIAIVDGLKKSELVNSLLDSIVDVQVKTEWEFKGYKFKGFKDAEGNNLLIDFKKMPDANPDKVEREIISRKIYLQMGMYAKEMEGIPEVYLIVFDATGNFSVIKMDWTLVSYGIREYEYLVTKFEQCTKQNRWNESYNFFDVQQRTIYKPKWIKGFETDPDNVE